MDLLTWAVAVLAGAAVGAVTGLLPGIHVNTLAALALVALPGLDAAAAVAFVAIATVHAFVGVLPSTYLGAPGEEQALSVLPAHRLLLEGQGPQAVRVAAGAALAAIVASLLLVLPFKWLVGEPARLLPLLDGAVPWVVGGTLLFLVGREAWRGPRRLLWSATTAALAGGLGLLSLGIALRGFVPAPSSPLLPLLSGLFGGAGLVASLHAGAPVPSQDPPERLRGGLARRAAGGVGLGIAAAAWTAAMPGLTSAVASALARAGSHDEDARPVLATLSAVNTAHTVFSFAMLWVALRSRTGLAMAVEAWVPVEAWDRGAAPEPFWSILAAVVASGILGYAATLALHPAFRKAASRVPTAALNGGALALLVAVVVVLSGPVGLALFATATLVGLVPLAAGVRRIHLTAALLVPVLVLRLGWSP